MKRPKRAKRPKVPPPPMAAAMRYQRILEAWLADLQAQILDYVERRWETNPVVFPGGRDDATSSWTKRTLGDLELKVEESLEGEELERALDAISKDVSRSPSSNVAKLVGVSLHSEAGIPGAMEAFRSRNVGLIKSLAGQQLDEVSTLLSKAEAGAWRVEDLRKEMEERFGVGRSKAQLLARDQVLKLNGQLNQLRQQNAGITEYDWSTSGDERVREFHQDLDGTRQRWDSPPVVDEDGRREHPGSDYQCRCTAIPVIPALEGASLDGASDR